MRKLVLSLLSILLICSCATYTVQQGRDSIRVPVSSDLAETRYSVLKEREDLALEAKLAVAREKERREAERKAAEEAKAKAEAERQKAMDVNNYPENLSSLSYPHIYSPLKSNQLKADESIVTLSALFIPLGNTELSQDNIEAVADKVHDINPDLVALTGSTLNQVSFAKSYGCDSATLLNGTVIYSAKLNKADENIINLQVTEKKNLDITILDYSTEFPWTKDDVSAWLKAVKSNENEVMNDALDKLSPISGKALLFLSSEAPSTTDWTTITDYFYRSLTSFSLSDALSARWQDVYRATHFSAELAPGITRRSYEVFERLDFIYSLSLMPLESKTIPLSGLTEETGNIALFATLVIPD